MKSCENCRYRKIDEKSLPCSACIDLGQDLSGWVGMKNGDAIRSMTDEELSRWISETKITGCPGDLTYMETMCDVLSCYDCWLEWLKRECIP